MASFTAVGDNVELQMTDKGETVGIDISGTYNMTILFQREVGSPGSGAWETLRTYTTANATVAEEHTTEFYNEKVRLIVTVDTSGTATATLADESVTAHDYLSVYDRVGNLIAEFTQGGMRLQGGLREGTPILHTANATLDIDTHAGRLNVFNDSDGATLTLPAATGSGAVYRFLVAVTVTLNNDIVQVANATDEFVGTLYQIDTDTADAIAAYPALDADGFDTVTLNGTTTGGLQGDYFEIEDVASGKFAIRGTVMGTGIVATPLSAAV